MVDLAKLVDERPTRAASESVAGAGRQTPFGVGGAVNVPVSE